MNVAETEIMKDKISLSKGVFAAVNKVALFKLISLSKRNIQTKKLCDNQNLNKTGTNSKTKASFVITNCTQYSKSLSKIHFFFCFETEKKLFNQRVGMFASKHEISLENCLKKYFLSYFFLFLFWIIISEIQFIAWWIDIFRSFLL